MNFELDPPDEPCPDCGSVHHRACRKQQSAQERVRDAVENYCGHSWPDDMPLPEVCPECDKIVIAVMRAILCPGGLC